jgi:chemotaxis protein MotA
MITGTMDKFELEAAMEREIETLHEENAHTSHALQKLSDGLPGFGIVAAVLGVVHTMESVGLPPEELGVLIARALVGTFLGILMAYGFVGPLANLMESRVGEKMRVLQSIKSVLIAYSDGNAPIVAVEYGRKALYSAERPSFLALEQQMKAIPKQAA